MKPPPKEVSEATCKLCGCTSIVLYDALQDRLVGSPGNWRLLRCANAACELAWLDPVPNPAQLAAAYSNYYTHAFREGNSPLRRLYDRLRVGYLSFRFGYCAESKARWEKLGGRLLACLPHRRAAFDASVMWLPATPGGKVLEVGCGNGNLLKNLQMLGWQVQGVEPDPNAAKIAASRNLPVRCGELAEQDFPPHSFDAIVMSHVIEHIADPIAFLQACRRLLKPGGRLIMLTPNLNAIGHRWFGRDWLHLDPPRHLNLFTQESLAAACTLAGFSDTTCETTMRDANWTLGGSLALSRDGHYRIGELSWPKRIAGFVMLYWEWLANKLTNSQAEELLVIAQE